MSDRFQLLRLIEALFFASAEPLGLNQIQRHLPEGADAEELLADLVSRYANRGVNLIRIGNRWALRTAPDLAGLMRIERAVVRKPSRAAVETLAIIGYHQPVTRAEIEEIRGVALSRGTLDTLLEAGWIKPKGRRRTPGRPVTWGTSEAFLDHFGLESLEALPGVAELKAAGLLDTRPAITALGSRGALPAAGEIAEERDPDEDEDELETLLAADFGEDLVPDTPAGPAGDEEEEDVSAERGAGDIEEAGPEEAGPAIGEEDDHPVKAAIAPGPDRF
ncbi:MAG: SMC-Scp complex subunit ScpB [Kiloniellales bacterium]